MSKQLEVKNTTTKQYKPFYLKLGILKLRDLTKFKKVSFFFKLKLNFFQTNSANIFVKPAVLI